MACLVATVAGAALPVGEAEAARGFSLGVNAGEITPTSARLWARANNPGTFFVQVAQGGVGGACRRGARVVVRRENDKTVQLQVRGLRPGTEYAYRFCAGRRTSNEGNSETAPRPSSTDTVRFGLKADLDGFYRGGRPAWNGFEVLGVMAREAFDFNVNLGDVIYADSIFPSPHAVTLPAKWAKYTD